MVLLLSRANGERNRAFHGRRFWVRFGSLLARQSLTAKRSSVPRKPVKQAEQAPLLGETIRGQAEADTDDDPADQGARQAPTEASPDITAEDGGDSHHRTERRQGQDGAIEA